MWIFLALVSAVGSAGTSFSLKRAVEHGGAVASTVAARLVAAALLGGVVAAAGGVPALSEEFWRAAALVIVPEVLGTLFLTLALRAGDLSVVQPLLGLLPPLVMAGGAAFLGEVPSAEAAAGAVLVTIGVYCVGLAPGARPLDPVRALARDRCAWFAVASAVSWSAATLVHKRGIDAVGPFPWGVTLALGPALVLAASLPFLPRRAPAPPRRPWLLFVALAGASFALQQTGLHLAFRHAQTGYVIAVSATGILISSALGIGVLKERSAPRTRFAGALLVSTGAMLVAAFG